MLKMIHSLRLSMGSLASKDDLENYMGTLASVQSNTKKLEDHF